MLPIGQADAFALHTPLPLVLPELYVSCSNVCMMPTETVSLSMKCSAANQRPDVAMQCETVGKAAGLQV